VGEPTEPKPVKLFAGLLTGMPELLEEVEDGLKREFGPVDCRSGPIPFDFTDYYREEMGEGIERSFLSFQRLIDPGFLPEIKLLTNELEKKISRRGKYDVSRPVNIDPGYLGLSKTVLATTKNYSHRLYLERGIYAEVTLQYSEGRFQPLPWTYPDYRTDKYLDFFARVREIYRKQLG